VKRLLWALTPLVLAVAAFAQAEGPSEGQRQRAAIAILLLVVGGMFVTYLLLWLLRRSGSLPEEKPADPLQDVKEEVARRSDELGKG
jgi:hypothetical protein